MAGSPVLKVFNPGGKYVASCKHLEDAACLANLYGKGAKVRFGHKGPILWHEGHEKFSAGESYDGAGRVMWERWQVEIERRAGI
jgi:hypothetical protein